MAIGGDDGQTVTRRALLAGGAAGAVGVWVGRSGMVGAGGGQETSIDVGQFPAPELEEATLADLGAALGAGEVSVRELVEAYLARIEAIDRSGPALRSVIETNPDAPAIADDRDRERRAGRRRGPLHGIPILVKDNIDTADAMPTTAGSLALRGSRPARDAFVVARLRAAGAVVLGKANLSEWANYRSSRSSSGWSARGGQTRNPYALGLSPCGSSSGSAAAVAANLAAAALGTETDGSIVCPAAACAVVGLKPTVGLTSRAGVVPIAASQDSVGPMARTVADAAALLAAIAGPDPRDPATGGGGGAPAGMPASVDALAALDPDGLRGARIGVPRRGLWGDSPPADAIAEAALGVLRALGAEVVDPADLPSIDALIAGPGEGVVLGYEFKDGIDAYLAERGDPEVGSLADLIRFNESNAAEELRFFGQDRFLLAERREPDADAVYRAALATNRRLARAEGIDAVMDRLRLDALVAPAAGPPSPIDLVNGDGALGGRASMPAAVAGYPIVTVPAGDAFGRPVGLAFFGRAWSEATLLRLAFAFEQATQVRRPPAFLPSGGEPSPDVGGLSGPVANPPAPGTGTATPAAG